MAQYSNLKAYIEEKIYENGTQAITGDILQDVLKVMTDDLGEFYQMGGVASPSTDPGTPDAKVIYFATEAGTYTNFGGITIEAGEVALLIFETSWTKETLNVLSAANGGVKTANLADGAVTTEKIAGGAVETAKIANNAVTSGKVADGAIGTAKIADAGVTADKIAANAVESAKIKNGAVTEGKINDGAVTADKVAANAVTTAKIADEAVTTAKLNDGAVTEDKIATDAVTSGKVKDGAIGTAKIAAGAVTHAKIGAGAVEESNIKDGAVTSDKIADGAVGSDQLAEGAFSAENLADGSVTTDKLADEAVTAEKIADGAVTADKFANGSVTTIKLGSGAVTTEKIGDGMVTRQKLADSSVGTSKIIDGAVTTDKVADGAITDAKLENPVSVSQNTLTIGGNYAGEVSTTYDVTLHNNGTTFDSLEALLSDANLNTLIPLVVRKGGMSIKFVCSSDNKYVQYFLKKNEWSTDPNDWENVSAQVAMLWEKEKKCVEKKNQVELLDNAIFSNGFFDIDGDFHENQNFKVSPFIEIKPETKYRIEGSEDLGQSTICYVQYDENYQQISSNYMSQGRTQAIVTGATAKYIRISVRNAAMPTKMFLFSLVDNKNIEYNPLDGYTNMRQWNTIVTPTNETKTSESLSDDARIALTRFPWYIKKNVHITYYSEFESFGNLKIGSGRSGDYSSLWLSINATKVAICSYGTQQQILDEVEHGLTLSTFIKVIIDVNNDGSWHYIIQTLGGYYDHTYQSTPATYGIYAGNVFVQAAASQATTNITLSATCDDLRKPIWIFGDSYISPADNYRWPFHIRKWFASAFNNFLLCGIAGGSTYGVNGNGKSTMDDVKRCLYYGTPKYLLWFIGMNDEDTGDVVNPNWMDGITELKNICETLHITLILATIPSTELVNNSAKDTWIKSSGLRYVDFSKAVHGDVYTSGVDNWYEGYCNDGIHPTPLGAQALATQLVVDFPEILDTL